MRNRPVWDSEDENSETDDSFGRVSYPGVGVGRKLKSATFSVKSRSSSWDWGAVRAGFREEGEGSDDDESADDHKGVKELLTQNLDKEVVVQRHPGDLWSNAGGSDAGTECYEDEDFENSGEGSSDDGDFEDESENYSIDDDFEGSDSHNEEEKQEIERNRSEFNENERNDGMSLKALTRLLLRKRGVISDGKKSVKNPGATGWERFMKKWPQRAKYIENLAKPKQAPRRKKEKGRVLTKKEMEEFVQRMRTLEKERWAKIIAMGHAEEQTFLDDIRRLKERNFQNRTRAGKTKDPDYRKTPFHERVQQRWRDKLEREARWADWYRERAWNNFRTQTPELYRAMLRAKKEDEQDALYHVRFWNFEVNPQLSKELKEMFRGFHSGSHSSQRPDPGYKKRRGIWWGSGKSDDKEVWEERKYAFYIFPINLCGCAYYANRYDAEEAANYMNKRTVFGKYEMPASSGGLKCRVGNVQDLFISRVLEGDVISQCFLNGYVYDADLKRRILHYDSTNKDEGRSTTNNINVEEFLERMKEDIERRQNLANQPYEVILKRYWKTQSRPDALPQKIPKRKKVKKRSHSDVNSDVNSDAENESSDSDVV